MTTEDARTVLKPCPFCGGAAERNEWDIGLSVRQTLGCWNDDCAAGPEVSGETLEDAAEVWNRRATTPPLEAVQQDARMKATAGHTPGPWRVEHDDNDQPNIYGADGHWIALLPHQCVGALEKQANIDATLIAQAWTIPALRAALENIIKKSPGGPHISAEAGFAAALQTIDVIREIARAALAETGE